MPGGGAGATGARTLAADSLRRALTWELAPRVPGKAAGAKIIVYLSVLDVMVSALGPEIDSNFLKFNICSGINLIHDGIELLRPLSLQLPHDTLLLVCRASTATTPPTTTMAPTTMVTLAALVASALVGTASGFSGAWGVVHRGGVVARARGLPTTVAAVVARRARPSMSMMADASTDQGSAYAQCSKVGRTHLYSY